MDSSIGEAKLITAPWALPVCGDPIYLAALVLRAGVIETICTADKLGDFYSQSELNELKLKSTNYQNAVLTPGLINLHTHLDYSLLSELYEDTEPTMFEWLPKLVQTSWGWSAEQWTASARHGISQSLRAGTTCLVDNSFTGQTAKILAQTGMRAVVGLELFGQDENLAQTAWQRWLEKYDRIRNDDDALLQSALKSGLIELTIAPHSPYTVAPALWKLANNWAQENDKPLLAHVAESAEECAWIYGKDETLDKYLHWVRELQAKAGLTAYSTVEAPPTPWRGNKQSPCEMLNENDLLNEHLIATHVVQASQNDINLLKEHDVSVVHCVRSNMRLKHGLAPIQKFRKAGLKVALGTDSLASAPDLNMLAEAGVVMRLHKSSTDEVALSAADALAMITIEAAKILGLSEKIGSLEKNKIADLAVFEYPDAISLDMDCDPTNLLFSARADVTRVYVEGRTIST